MELATTLALLLGLAVLVPLLSFWVIFGFGYWLRGQAAIVATGAIFASFVLSIIAAGIWLANFPPVAAGHDSHAAGNQAPAHSPSDKPADKHGALAPSSPLTSVALVDPAHPEAHPAEAHPAGESTHGGDSGGHHAKPTAHVTGEVWTLGTFGGLRIAVSYYIDALTITMFCMVSLIATCIHVYAQGYMHDELHEIVDHEVPVTPKAHEHGHDHGHGHDSHGHDAHGHAPAVHHDEAHPSGDDSDLSAAHDDGHGHGHGHDDEGYLHRPGRFHRFFQYLSLFCFSMLGLLFAGNIAMVFMFWELVGVCSYFLIGFYVERESASTAANKAFIVNRVGDFGMIIGLMALWAGLGTFAFGDIDYNGKNGIEVSERGLFSQVRTPENGYELRVPEKMIQFTGGAELADSVAEFRKQLAAEGHTQAEIEKGVAELQSMASAPGYWLLIIAGVGIFCGCVGKSAQFPLHTWLPDAMEGPTPVSALVHSATMVAAGVYLVARFYPVFTPEVLLVISTVGCITLFIAATIAITATDIKRVLAYSTISQLGYMMLALGLGGWVAGVMHLITHAFFKSLLFLCSGSVIHSVHTNDMSLMGGLRQKMPITAYTMLVGCLAIAGAGIPFIIGLSGYYSKDSILEQSFSFWQNGQGDLNRTLGPVFFCFLAGGAAITAFYMFRLWFLTFEGEPRDQARFDHAHESPMVMCGPLLVLSVFAICVAWPLATWTFGYEPIDLHTMLESARPAGTNVAASAQLVSLNMPDEHLSHADSIVGMATVTAFFTALGGILIAGAFYWWKAADPDEVRAAFPGIYKFLINKWYFDELYDLIFVQPVFFLAYAAAAFDRAFIDAWIVDFSARITKTIAIIWEFAADQIVVDGIANGIASSFYSLGTALREVQTGSVRQYVLFIVVGTVGLFILISFFWSLSLAG